MLKTGACILLLALTSLIGSAEFEDDAHLNLIATPPKCYLGGQWQNKLGSRINLQEHENEEGRFSGTYRTAVEGSSGSSGNGMTSPVTASIHPNATKSFVFTVFWPKGSGTTWIGQCYETQRGLEVLETTWLLHSNQSSLENSWMSTRIGTDTFRRV